MRRRKGAACFARRFVRRREKKRKRRRWRRRISDRERERRRLGDRKRDDFALILCAGEQLTQDPGVSFPHFCGHPLASTLVLIVSQSFKLVWVRTNTLKDALIAAPLYSSLVCTKDANSGGGGARLRRADGERVISH